MTSSTNRMYIKYHYAARGGPSHGHRYRNMHKNLVKIAHAVRRYDRGQTQTQTDTVITMLPIGGRVIIRLAYKPAL